MNRDAKAIETEYDKGVSVLVTVADTKAEALVRKAVADITAMKVSRIRFGTDTWYIYIEQGMYERIDIRRWICGKKHGQPDGPPFQWGNDKHKIRMLCDLLDWWDRLTSGRSFKIAGDADKAAQSIESLSEHAPPVITGPTPMDIANEERGGGADGEVRV